MSRRDRALTGKEYAMVHMRRLLDQPIIEPNMDGRIGSNINGPSLMRVPSWVTDPLGQLYLYFADHRGTYIRLAVADEVTGPWRMHTPGCLDLADSRFAILAPDPEQSLEPGLHGAYRYPQLMDRELYGVHFYAHIASPDVVVCEERREIRMYFHGMCENGEQLTRVAISSDGLTFDVLPDLILPPYARVFRHGGRHYALTWPGTLYRSNDGLTGFEPGPGLLDPRMRHGAVLERDGTLHVLWSRVGDAPEQLLYSSVALHADWRDWRASEPHSVLKPELDWEGANLPCRPSLYGAVDTPVNELRDPALCADGDRIIVLYCGAGEHCIGLAELLAA